MNGICLKNSRDLGIIPRSLLLIKEYKDLKKRVARYKKIKHDNS